MHGRARVSVKHQQSDAGAKEAAKDKKKAAQYAEQLAEVLRNHKEKVYGREAVDKSAALIKTNPDMYTAWNYRKLALKVLLADANDAAKARMFEQELLLIFEALQVNPKAYGAWYHRKWILGLMGAHAPLQREFKLLDKLLKQDERNFHGWAYRRFLVRQGDAPDAQELAFAQQKIDETFSNFSAWHYRSKLLTKMHLSGKTTADEQASAWLEPEFELVDNALFTDPNDTSAWIYQAWLLQNTVPDSGSVLRGMWPPSGVTVPLAKPPNASSNPPELPAILLFSKPVSGVNRHTAPVTIRTAEQSVQTGQDWTPVGAQDGASKVWVQELPIKNADEGAEVHVHVGAGPGILTPDGVQVVRSASSTFTVRTADASEAEAVCLHESDPGSEIGDADTSSAEKAGESEQALPGYAASKVLEGPGNGKEKGWRGELFARQLDLREQQEELEQGKSKWILLGKGRLLTAMRRLSMDGTHLQDEQRIYQDLIDLDPMHAEYYWEMLGQLRLEELTADRRKLESHVVRVFHGGLPSHQLRLSGLALRRLGSLDALLWVQHLNLSHNALRSVEGIEALQLLRSLDLSHNRVSHASGLAVLHLLPHLRWLNLASNRLGTSLVDTQSYSSHIHSEIVVFEVDTCPTEVRRVLGALAGLKLDILDVGGNEIMQIEGCVDWLKVNLPRTTVKL